MACMPEVLTPAIRILVLDDHALFRESVARLLSAEPDFEVVATCGTVQEALAVVRQKPTDIILLDYDLGQSDGAQFMRSELAQHYTGKVLVVTAGIEKQEAADLIRSGVSGIFAKSNSAASLAEGIHDVMAGKVWFDSELLREVLGAAESRSEPRTSRFTEREELVLSGVFEGLASKEIANRLEVSESSVKATLQQLFSKTGVRTRSQLVRVALEHYKTEGDVCTVRMGMPSVLMADDGRSNQYSGKRQIASRRIVGVEWERMDAPEAAPGQSGHAQL